MWVVEIYGNHSIHYMVSGNFLYSEIIILECRACGVVAIKKGLCQKNGFSSNAIGLRSVK